MLAKEIKDKYPLVWEALQTIMECDDVISIFCPIRIFVL